MKIEIEDYKGQSITYNDDTDKFECEISIEDRFKSTKRQSLKDVRKEIDAFIKLNVEFKPFTVFQKSSYGDGGFSVLKLASIRTDGKFVDERSSHYDKKATEKWFQYDADIEKKQKAIELELKTAEAVAKKAMQDLAATLTPVDLSKYEHIMNPNP